MVVMIEFDLDAAVVDADFGALLDDVQRRHGSILRRLFILGWLGAALSQAHGGSAADSAEEGEGCQGVQDADPVAVVVEDGVSHTAGAAEAPAGCLEWNSLTGKLELVDTDAFFGKAAGFGGEGDGGVSVPAVEEAAED